MNDPQVPGRESFISNVAEHHCFVVVVDYKVVGAVFVVSLSAEEAMEYRTIFQLSSVLGEPQTLSYL